ncbi:pyrroline-5-carboxylate reductase [Gardnerella vaginalis]|uniref:pyrroline-5-carboxylate reductase n=1 Tax=Gardnerella vaginalis TaxID=2702 RepID=UPI0039EF2F97
MSVKTFGTVGFIGYGNMAQAIAKGAMSAGVLQGENIVACAHNFEKLERNTSLIGARAMHTAKEVCEASDAIIIAVKPYQVVEVLEPIVDFIKECRLAVISVAAGWTLERYQKLLGEDAHVQCIIPNTPIAVGQGVTLAETNHSLTDSQLSMFNALFETISLVERVDAEHMNIAMCISSCAPAFTAMYIEALGDAGVKYGLQRDCAYRLAAKMIEGVGALYMDSRTHPGIMKDAVCSPGGTTIRGVAQLESRGFRGDVISAVDAIENK